MLKNFRSPVAHQTVFEVAPPPDDQKPSASRAKTRLRQAVTANEYPETLAGYAAVFEHPNIMLDQLLERLCA